VVPHGPGLLPAHGTVAILFVVLLAWLDGSLQLLHDRAELVRNVLDDRELGIEVIDGCLECGTGFGKVGKGVLQIGIVYFPILVLLWNAYSPPPCI
jgi:hypothetical protein